ncbi:MAG TPA: pyridoxal-phosphate dependent enzyme [Patescibacteria group bacterium]|nr:pyridoxal-phosphate dependent enzyme [Patescibacteria group bacterium]
MTEARPGVATLLPSALVCAGCGLRLPDDAPLAFACPAARPGDDVDHVLARVLDPGGAAAGGLAEDAEAPNPYLRWRTRFHAWHRARALGWSDADYVRLVGRLDTAVAKVDGHGFRITPFARSAALSDALGFADPGGVWVKDETGNVSGSHKARHLFGTLLELAVEEARRAAAAGPAAVDPAPADEPAAARAPLAIASCGNAALAAAVVARAAERHLDVFIPRDADPVVVARLRSLGAACTVCEREPGVAGDPTYHALLRAIAAGAVPFTCQGNLNGLAIEGGETLGWELAAAVGAPGGPARLDRVVVQVGGGALLSSVIGGLQHGGAVLPRIHAVQPATVHPLARAFERVRARVAAGEPADDVLADAARHRSAFMWPWEDEPHSVAHGIIDDETYDWRACVAGMLASGGGPVIASEATLDEANAMARAATGIDVDHTGSAGLAGLLELVRTRAIHPDENVAVLFTGALRRPEAPAPGANPAIRAAHPRPHSHDATSGGH